MSLVQDTYESMLAGVAERLAPEGFRRSGRCVRRTLPGNAIRWDICFQKSRHSTAEDIQFTAEVSVEWKRRPADYDDDYIPDTTWYRGAGNRIGFFMPKKEDTWWDINEATTPAALNAEINGVITSCVLPFFKRFETERDIEEYWREVATKEMRLNYGHAISVLELDLRENKDWPEIEKQINRVRFLGKINGVPKPAVDAKLERVFQVYGRVLPQSQTNSFISRLTRLMGMGKGGNKSP